MNLGAKFYIDVIPFIDAIEIGGNFGVWEYDGRIRYPDSISFNGNPGSVTSLLEMQRQGFVKVNYDTMDLTLRGAGIDFLGMSLTPYAKLEVEANVRKYIKIPVIDNVIKPYAGVGANVTFATPALSAGLVNNALASVFDSSSSTNLAGGPGTGSLVDILSDQENSKKIVTALLNRLMTPHYGAQIVAGVMIKAPIIPIGIYVDGKYMIPFEAYDKNAQITGRGLLVNLGVLFGF